MRQIDQILIVSSDTAVVKQFRTDLFTTERELIFVSEANDGIRQALELDIDLIILDSQNSSTDPYSLVARFKSNKKLEHTPIILISDKDVDYKKSMDAGCADVILRPIDKDLLIVKIETSLKLNQYRAVLEEKAKLDDILDAMEDGIVILDRKLDVTRVNPKARLFLAISGSGQGAPFITRVKELFTVHYEGDLEKDIFEKNISLDLEREETPTIRPLIIEARTSVIHDAFREVTHIVVFMADVTESRKKVYQEELFLNLISHKLRTPLAIVHKNASLFHKNVLGPLTDDQAKFMKVLYEKCCELVDSFEKLLGFTMIKSKKLDLPDEPINLEDCMLGNLESLARRTPGKKVTFQVQCKEKDMILHLNRRYFEMIFNNVIENGVKFNESSEVTLSISAQILAGERVRITVKDNGPGIPAEEWEKIFEQFYQVDKHRTLNIVGTGLGLAIAKHVATAMGGEIGVASKMGEGSEFHFIIPGLEKEKQ